MASLELLNEAPSSDTRTRTTLFGDGSIRSIPQGLDPQALRALLTRDGGESAPTF